MPRNQIWGRYESKWVWRSFSCTKCVRLRHEPNGWHFESNYFKCGFLTIKLLYFDWNFIKIVPKSVIDNKSALFQVKVWRWTGEKLLSEPMLTENHGVMMTCYVCQKGWASSHAIEQHDNNKTRGKWEPCLPQQPFHFPWNNKLSFINNIFFQVSSMTTHQVICAWLGKMPRQQGSWGQHWAHLGLTGPRWAPWWPHELCYLGEDSLSVCEFPVWSLFYWPDLSSIIVFCGIKWLIHMLISMQLS